MATRVKKKKDKVIDITTPLKKNQLSLDYMKEYIKENDPNGKDDFIKEALVEGRYNPKNARDYFCTKYPEAVILPKEKNSNDATAKLLEW